jgi:hypothetical protein
MTVVLEFILPGNQVCSVFWDRPCMLELPYPFSERNYPLYEWTKATIQDPAKRAKHIKSFAIYVDDNEVYANSGHARARLAGNAR